MGLTKKDLQKMISEAVKTTIIKEIKPLIMKTIKQEFRKIIEEADSKPKQTITESDELSMTQLLQSPPEEDETRQAVSEKIFSGGRGGKFADILNQTADERLGGQSLTAPSINTQQEIVLDNTSTEKVFDRTKLAEQLGYGDDLGKVGAGVKVPGTVVSLPTTTPDGAPINFNKVPEKIVKNMMKDYSGLLKKTEQKVKKTRG